MFKNLITRIQIDWQEWRNYKTSMWNVKRDNRMIARAKQRAKTKNAKDGRTYYILRDVRGGINEFNSTDIKYWSRIGILPRMDHAKRLESSLGIVTSNTEILDQYSKLQNQKETINK